MHRLDYHKSLIVKRQILSEICRQLFHCDAIFANEITAYNNIIPPFIQFSCNRLPFPQCIFAGTDNHSSDIIVLEDLCSAGYSRANRWDKLTYAECSQVMTVSIANKHFSFYFELQCKYLKELGNLHAISFAMKSVNPDAFHSVRIQIKEISYEKTDTTRQTLLYDDSLLRGIKSVKTTNTLEGGGYTKIITKLEKLAGNLSKIIQTLLADGEECWNVICHGDCSMNNLMLKRNNDKTVEVKLIDLQAMRYGSAITDLLYFIYSSTERTLRINHLDQLIGDYHTSLVYSLKLYVNDQETRQELETRYTYQSIQKEFKNNGLYGLGIGLWLLPALTFNRGHVIDLESLSSDTTELIQSVDDLLTADYHRRVKDVVMDMDEMGCLDFVNDSNDF